MDPNLIELTLSQKFKALARGVDNLFPLVAILGIILSLVIGQVICNTIPHSDRMNDFWNFMLVHILIGNIFGVIVFFIGLGLYALYEDALKPFIKKCGQEYKEECDNIKLDMIKNVDSNTEKSLLR